MSPYWNDSPSFYDPSSAILNPKGRIGIDSDWGGLMAAAWSAVADGQSDTILPSIDSIEKNLSYKKHEGPFLLKEEAYIALWSAILQILKYSFGWRSPAHGIARWVEAGLPTDDRRFAVITRLLGDDVKGRATNLAAFLFHQGGWELTKYGHQGGDDPFEMGSEFPPPTIPGWVTSEYNYRCGEEEGSDNPVDSPDYLPSRSGGWDNMHLSGHCWAPISRTAQMQGAPIRAHYEQGEMPTFVANSDGERGFAVLMTNTYVDWFDDLRAYGDKLPPLSSGRSWRVDVVCKPVGWLGTFRKSRETGLWFSGSHSLHAWGEWKPETY